MPTSDIKIGLMGGYSISDGYPNVKWLIKKMKDSQDIEIIYGQTCAQNKNRIGLFNQGSKSKIRFLLVFATMLNKSLTSLIACLYLYHRKKINIVYAPYPAHMSLFFLSFLPKKIRPPVIVDGFISLYDSAVLDRKVLEINGILAKFLFWFEKRSLDCAEAVIVDTKCSAEYLSLLLKLNSKRIINFPLMTDEENYLPSEYSKRDSDQIEVLFVGTFVPLQGVEIIAKAARVLSKNPNINFTFVGYGQTANNVEKILGESNANVRWIKEWQSPGILNDLISNSDMCLGIFGNTEKASRVWPFKNYSSMYVGRSVISQETQCIPNIVKNKAEYPYLSIPPDDVNALAEAINKLASSFTLRQHYAKQSEKYYLDNLSNDIVFTKYLGLFEKMCIHNRAST